MDSVTINAKGNRVPEKTSDGIFSTPPPKLCIEQDDCIKEDAIPPPRSTAKDKHINSSSKPPNTVPSRIEPRKGIKFTGGEKKRSQSLSFHSPSSSSRNSMPILNQPVKTTRLVATKPSPTTPKSWSKKQMKASRILPARESPLFRRAPIMSSTAYTPQSNKHSSYFPLKELFCYHCGNTINLEQAVKAMEHSSKLTLEEVGRTVFDLEKLSDTGCASKSISFLEGDLQHFVDGYDIVPAKLRTVSELNKIAKVPDSLPVPLQKTEIAHKKRRDKPEHSSSIIDNVDVIDWLPSPIFCEIDNGQSWNGSTLDLLDVEEMLKLLETTPESKEKTAEKQEMLAAKVTPMKKEKNPSLIPTKQLRSRTIY